MKIKLTIFYFKQTSNASKKAQDNTTYISQSIFYFSKYKHILNIKHTKMTEANKTDGWKKQPNQLLKDEQKLLSAKESAQKDEKKQPNQLSKDEQNY